MRLLRLIWQNPRRHHSTTQYQAHTLSSLCYLKIHLKPSTYLHKEFRGEKEGPKASITSLNKTKTCDGYDFNIHIINNYEYFALQKDSLMFFGAYCIFDFWEFFKGPSVRIPSQIKIIHQWTAPLLRSLTWHHQDSYAGNLGTAFLLGQFYFSDACLLVMCVSSHITKIWNHVFYVITNYG